jgi:hypothetical protein
MIFAVFPFHGETARGAAVHGIPPRATNKHSPMFAGGFHRRAAPEGFPSERKNRHLRGQLIARMGGSM